MTVTVRMAGQVETAVSTLMSVILTRATTMEYVL